MTNQGKIGKYARELLAEPRVHRQNIFGPWFKEANLLFMFGPRGCGKSSVALAMAHSAATKSKLFFPNWQPSRVYKVLYFDSEMGAEAMAIKIGEVDSAGENSLFEDTLKLVTANDMGGKAWNISSPECQKQICDMVEDFEILIFDNYLGMSGKLYRGDDDETIWKRVEQFLVTIRESGRSAIVVHHSGKSGDQLGTSIKENVMDTVVKITPTEDDTVRGVSMNLFFTKHRWVTQRVDREPIRIHYQEETDRIQAWKVKTLRDANIDFINYKRACGWSKKDLQTHLRITGSELNELIGTVKDSSRIGSKQEDLFSKKGEFTNGKAHDFEENI